MLTEHKCVFEDGQDEDRTQQACCTAFRNYTEDAQ